MNNVIAIIGCFLLFWSSSSIAGGTSWNFEIIKLALVNEHSGNIKLKLNEKSDDGKWLLGQCSIVNVNFSYSPELWPFKTWSSFVTKEVHLKAVEYLATKGKSKGDIRLGVMGAGLLASKSDPCTFVSRGFDVEVEYSGKLAVYSYHNGI